jgi:tRNA pseudouridine38-40 synthase
VTVQGTLEKAIGAVTQEQIRVIGSGRTDAGGHALHQVVAFSTESALPVETLCRAINAHLPDDVSVTGATDADIDFHPRFDAASRSYRYLIWNRPIPSPFWVGRAAFVKPRLEESAMDVAARSLLGRHDFSAFADVREETNHYRHMYRAECRRDGDLVVLELEASGFMRQMVRSIAGTLIRIGSGRMSPESMQEILTSLDRSRAGDTAPACGLYLIDVRYADSASPNGLGDPFSTKHYGPGGPFRTEESV